MILEFIEGESLGVYSIGLFPERAIPSYVSCWRFHCLATEQGWSIEISNPAT